MLRPSKYDRLHSKENHKDDSKHIEKSGKTINFIVHCNGSNIGNGVGIGNGNLNGGGGGSGDCDQSGNTGNTGNTGYTGSSGDDGPVCDSRCNLVCEQVYLQQTVSPSSVSRIGQELTWTLTATNISGKRISGALVVSSSLFGTVLLTDRGLNPGETVTVVYKMTLEQGDFQSNNLSSVAYVAVGIPTGTPGRYDPGTRVSPVVVTNVYVNLPELDLIGNIIATQTETGKDVRLELTLKNVGSLPIRFFDANLANIFVDCTPVIEGLNSPFRITEDKQLLLIRHPLLPEESLAVAVVSTNCLNCLNCLNCVECCLGDFPPQRCSIDYRYNSEQGPIMTNSITIPVTNA